MNKPVSHLALLATQRINPVERAKYLWSKLEKPSFVGVYEERRDLKELQELMQLMAGLDYAILDSTGVKDANTMRAEVQAVVIAEAKKCYRSILTLGKNTIGFENDNAYEDARKLNQLLGFINADHSRLAEAGEDSEDIQNKIKRALQMTLIYTIRGCLLEYYTENNFTKPTCFTNILPKTLSQLKAEYPDADYRFIDPKETTTSDQMRSLVDNLCDRKPDILVIDFMHSRFYKPDAHDPERKSAMPLARVFARELEQLGLMVADIKSASPTTDTERTYALLGHITMARVEQAYINMGAVWAKAAEAARPAR